MLYLHSFGVQEGYIFMKERSIRATLIMIIFPLLIALIVSIAFFSSRLKSISASDKELYYDKLYNINAALINADRDFYRAMLAADQYHLEIELLSATDLETRKQIYKENKESAIANVRAAVEIAKTDPSLFTGTVLEEDDSTFSDYYDRFEANYGFWDSMYSIDEDRGFWSNYCSQFEVTRKTLVNLTDITLLWADRQIEQQKAKVAGVIKAAIVIFVVVSVVLIFFVFVVMNLIIKAITQIDGAISNMADGDFVTEVRVKTSIKEFNNIAAATDGMRIRLKDALLKVVGHAEAVNTGADVTEESITNSRRTTGDISSAIDGVAHGATAMADDVQNTNSIAVDMGYAVGNVIDAANANMEKGQAVYDESLRVQKQLEELKAADLETDRMAGEVADSVHETATVVEDISNAAKAIIGIAQQTNLLALNAAIEAARAGDAGRGFAVVADNIGQLAAQSNQTAGQITEMLGRITALSEHNKELTNVIKEATARENVALDEMVTSFDGMLTMLKETEVGNRSIMDLAKSLDDAKNKITEAVESLSSISQENAASTQETNSSVQQLNANMENIVAEAQNLKAIAAELQANIGYFKVEGGEEEFVADSTEGGEADSTDGTGATDENSGADIYDAQTDVTLAEE